MKFSNIKNKFITRKLEKLIGNNKVGKHKADRLLFLTVIILTLVGILMVYDSSGIIGIRNFNDINHYVKEQLQGIIFGFVGLIIFWKFNYKNLYNFALPGIIAIIILLILVFLPGIGVKAYGANRWVNFGFFNLQPSEFAKLSLVLYLSAWFSSKEKNILKAFVILVGTIVGLVAIEPDIGTSIVILGTAIIIYFYSGANVKHFLLLIPLILLIMTFVIIIAPYRMQRIMTFLDPTVDPQGSSYQIRQALIAIGSGGWFGNGVGQSRQKYEFLPEANTDAIFAIVGEELGFVGSFSIIFLYMFLIWRGLRISKHAPDDFSKYLSGGIISWIGIQTIINIGALVALMPFTGVPLPFISFGSSSLVVSLCAMGILLNISTHWK